MFHRSFSIHRYAMLSAMGKLVWAFVSNLWAVCPISTKQGIYSSKRPGQKGWDWTEFNTELVDIIIMKKKSFS